ncbi:oligosaccharide flippase family protein [Rhizobiaceae bacterium BDR2-2]|uniref:Oligosaccharide flippase family protein n=1 Tax=Ectorhizobium quercum TaxID=2965071 RepID=A0AAE3MXD0_9HYPH|nr:oligosaccharide flippase family protein [Ectorhizobium quercum]MCX8996221.1 oligosaccharide flippase family protein [Ectorhizobium quercum]MCX8998740.1 oligosaccharide flippase family protein [Ectorhizobium quercum]
MAISQRRVVTGAMWTIGTYVLTVGIRFVSNIILSRIVVPEVFGVLMIITTLKFGIELLTDVGIAQNVVRSKDGDKKSFQNTAWTLQFVRGLVLFGLLTMAAYPLSQIYQIPASAIQLSGLTLVILGAASTSIYYLQRQMQLMRMNLFDLAVDAVSAVLVVGLALINPTVWSIIAANLLGAAFRATLSYALPRARNWFEWNRAHVEEVLSFGKWIFLSSILSFLCMNFDKLFLAQSLPLAVVGVYAIARTIADLPSALIGRISYQLVFPLIAAHAGETRAALRRHVGSLRLKLLLGAAFCMAFGISVADIATEIIYDSRYHEAGWMLAMLLVGIWFSIVCTVNDYMLLGLGKPVYAVIGNSLKLAGLVALTPVASAWMGLPGAIMAISACELFRYLPVVYGQWREQISFVRQDVLVNAALVAFLALFLFVRLETGFGTPFDAIPGF